MTDELECLEKWFNVYKNNNQRLLKESKELSELMKVSQGQIEELFSEHQSYKKSFLNSFQKDTSKLKKKHSFESHFSKASENSYANFYSEPEVEEEEDLSVDNMKSRAKRRGSFQSTSKKEMLLLDSTDIELFIKKIVKGHDRRLSSLIKICEPVAFE